MTKVGVGHSAKRRSTEAGGEAVRAALAALHGSTPDLLLVFANPGYDQTSLLATIREIAGHRPLLSGCSSEGIIFRDGCNEQACAVNVMAIASEEIAFHAFNVPGFSKDPQACGAQIARHIGELGPERARAAFVFPDGLTGNTTEMLRSLDAALPFRLPISGGTAAAMFRPDSDNPRFTHQYLNGTVTSDSVSVLVVGGPLLVDVAVSHGCRPLGTPRTVTAADGGWLREIDGLPAWEALRASVEGIRLDPDTVHICVGEPIAPALWTEYGSDFRIRTPLILGADGQSVFFPGGLQLGNQVQLARREPERVAANAEQSAHVLARRHPGQAPIAVFQFDCAGRGHMLFGEDASRVGVRSLQKVFGGCPPWIGFHTFGEIAPIAGRVLYHGCSVALCALYEA